MRIVQAFDGAPITAIAVDNAANVEAKLAKAHEVFRDRAGWLSAAERIAILRRLAALVEAEAGEFATLIVREGGKPVVDAKVEVARAVNGILGAISILETTAGSEIPMGLTPASEGRLAFTTREPIGIVAAISAFNHPLNLIVHQVVPAIAVGCPVIVKPANPTPLCCIRLVELAQRAGLPGGWCQTVVVDDLSLAEKLATDPRVAFLSFIGSAKVGWYLRSKVAPGTRVALEHGGAAPVLIHRSADLKKMMTPLIKGAYYHAGQVCVSVQRIFVHEEVKAAFLDGFVAAVQKLETGDPALATTDVGPLIGTHEVERVRQWVAEAQAQGASLLTGGNCISDRVYEPTVLLEPPPHANVSAREIFGPVTCVYGFTEMDEAIQRANSLPFAFQAAVFTSEIDVALRAAKLLDASAVMINDHTAFRTDWMPFAGRRQSGLGIGGIPYTMRDFTHEKMIVLRSS